jgi:hypothetical protein
MIQQANQKSGESNMFSSLHLAAFVRTALAARVRPHLFAVWRYLFALAVAVLLGATVAAAQTGTYEIKGLGVDATAKDANEAKIVALKQGQAAAFNLLVRRLAVVSDPSQLPQFTNAEIAQTIAGLTIEQEKTSATRYIARLTVRFRSAEVKKLLSQFQIPFADQRAAPILLLAVWDRPGKSVLWDNPNPWRDAWARVDGANSITPILLPLGDLTDVSIAAVEDVARGAAEKLAQLKKRYGTDFLMIARAGPDAGNTKITVEIKGESPMGQVEFTQEYPLAGAGLPGVLFKAAREFVTALELRWKQENRNLALTGTLIPVAVPFTSLDQWKLLRQEITAATGAGTVEIKSLSAQGALVNIRYRGSAEQLAQMLAQRGLVLTNVGNGWVLERR